MFNVVEMLVDSQVLTKNKTCVCRKDFKGFCARESLYGGRTEAIRTQVFARTTNSQGVIEYVDVTSLLEPHPTLLLQITSSSRYPYVMWMNSFPVGHCVHLFDEKIKDVDKLIAQFPQLILKCRLLPPRNLIFPLLPLKVKQEKNGKLSVYTLCRVCAEKEQKGVCRHSDIERSFETSVTKEELVKVHVLML